MMLASTPLQSLTAPLEWGGTFLVIALVPFLLVLTTAFTRISIILTFLRQALATSVPSTQIIIALSLILTAYVMHPVITEVNEKAVKPFFASETKDPQILLENGWPPLRTFMLANTREKDLFLFLEMGKIEAINSTTLPWTVVIPAFVISELRTAFLMGFLLFLPFLVIDLLVASLLMSMNMVMLPPVVISFPFKLLLFIVVDGWRLIAEQIVVGYK